MSCTDLSHFHNSVFYVNRYGTDTFTQRLNIFMYGWLFSSLSWVTLLFKFVQDFTPRRMPGHIREFNRLEPHSSHDLVFNGGIIRLKRHSDFFVSDCELLVTKSLWVPPEYLYQETSTSINASLSDFTGFFALKTNQKIAIFVWIFTCVDFRAKITTKVCRNRKRCHLIS